jgi:acetyltransferase-like isoleucine patch superfamily enzyme
MIILTTFYLFKVISLSIIENEIVIPCASFRNPKNGSVIDLEFIIPNDIFAKDYKPIITFKVIYEIDTELCLQQFQKMSCIIINYTETPPTLGANIPINLEVFDISTATKKLSFFNVTAADPGKFKFILIGTDFFNNEQLLDSINVEVAKKVKFAGKKTVELYSTGGKTVTLNFGRGTYPNEISNLFRVFHFDDYNWVVNIGAFCSIAQNFEIMLAKSTLGPGHNYKYMTSYPFSGLLRTGHASDSMFFSKNFYNGTLSQNKTLTIGNDVWIGMDVKIVNDIVIGNGATIGAYSVVRENVPPYAIVVGNPAKIIKYRYEEKYIRLVQDLKWWDWTDDELTKDEIFNVLENYPEKYFNE